MRAGARIALLISCVFVISGAARIGQPDTRAAVRVLPSIDEVSLLGALETGVNGDAGDRSRSVRLVQSAVAGESVRGRVAYYPVVGATRDAIRRSILLKRGRYTHEDYDANTQWCIHYRYSRGKSPSPGSSTFTASEDITITMPAWSGVDGSEVGRVWHAYSRHLRYHEEGHYLIDEACLAAMTARVAKLPGDAPFSQVDALCKQTMRDYDAMNVDYDRITNHGATQGAVF